LCSQALQGRRQIGIGGEEDEFVIGTDRLSKLLKRSRPEQMEQKMSKRDAKAERKARKAAKASGTPGGAPPVSAA